MSHDTSGPSGTLKKKVAKPRQTDHKHKSQNADKEINGVREGEQGHVVQEGRWGLGQHQTYDNSEQIKRN